MYKSSTPIIPPSNYILPIKTPATSIYNNSKLLLSPSSSISPNKLLSSYELDFDVIGITNEANHCHLNDNDDSNNDDDICGDQVSHFIFRVLPWLCGLLSSLAI